MRIAVLGVGLIGGSIGLAARRRLGVEVAGYDPDGGSVDAAVELGAIDDRPPLSVEEACAGAELIFCAAPVDELPRLVLAALASSAEDALVTDVGSIKNELAQAVSGSPGEERFIGGHPLAGAETSGVENARPDLFEGARWYLTPTGSSSGVMYDRLQRVVADLGARPQALDPAAHDRIMATVSHLPHVLADVLASQAAEALADEHERLPQAGPSLRDATRVAGANPGLWAGIFAANGAVVANEIDAVVERLQEAAALLRRGQRQELEDWQRGAREHRRLLLEADLVGGPLHELRVQVENRPGTVAELALELGRAAVNIEDMALYPAADMRTGAISLWVAGVAEAERAAELVRALGHDVSVVSAGE
jgi:prephenate dehydrogenase